VSATVITVANQKGGTGKTTTAANIAAALAAEDRRVLAVDIDAQTNLTFQLGAALDVPFTARELLDPAIDVSLAQTCTRSPHGLDVVPAGEGLSELEIGLAVAVAGQTRLRQVLKQANDIYDVIVVDTPPNLGLLTINGLVAADVVLCPVSAEDVAAAQGLTRLRANNLRTAPLRDGHAAPVVVLLTRWDRRRVMASRMEATLRSLDAPPVARIPSRADVHQAAVDRVPMTARAPDGLIAREYRAAAHAALEQVMVRA